MLRRLLILACVLALTPLSRADDGTAAFEQKIAEATKSSKVTVVHFWAPWCPNCKHELANGGWSTFIAANPNVNFIFVTTWNAVDGHELLEKNGVGAEPNFQLYLHPNHSRKRGEMVSQVLGMPISWIPSTWVFKDGHLTYAMNYGELRFPVLSQLITDSSDSW
jgi:thiol-disulfide isomerase/thioredoxin